MEEPLKPQVEVDPAPLESMDQAQKQRDQLESFGSGIEGAGQAKVVIRFVERYIADGRPEVRELAETIKESLERTMKLWGREGFSIPDMVWAVMGLASFHSPRAITERLKESREYNVLTVLEWADKEIPSVLSPEEVSGLKVEK